MRRPIYTRITPNHCESPPNHHQNHDRITFESPHFSPTQAPEFDCAATLQCAAAAAPTRRRAAAAAAALPRRYRSRGFPTSEKRVSRNYFFIN
jgi:hypothetical protein